MADFPDFKTLFRVARDEALLRGGQLTLSAVDRDGSDANILLAAAAFAADEVVGQLVNVAAGVFLDSANGQALDRLVFDRYSLLRKAASPSIGTVQFTTTSANPTAFTIQSGTTLQTSDGVQFITTQAETFPMGAVGPITVPVRSTLAGANQQAASNTISSIIAQITNQAPDLAVTNLLATAGADDAEDDTSLRNRARLFFTTSRKGTLAAIEAAALAVPGVTSAKAVEVSDVLGRPNRFVQLIITDQFTDALVQQGINPPAYQTQSQQLAQTIFDSLSDTRAAGMFVQVFVAAVVLQPVTLKLRFVAGVDVDFVATAARAAIAAYINSLNPGQSLTIDGMLGILETVGGLQFVGDEITSPAGDVIPQALQVIRTSLTLVQAGAIQTDSSAAVLAGTTLPDVFVIRNL